MNSINHLPHTHIVIDPYTGTYTLLDSDFKVVDTIYRKCNIPIIKHFYKKSELRKFKKELKSDFKNLKKDYKQYESKNSFVLPSTRDKYCALKETYNNIKLYLSLCPDADYEILRLLKNNITRIDSGYKNYFAACADYLKELAKDCPEKNNLPFDFNYACKGNFDDIILGNHVELANTFARDHNPVKKYLEIILNEKSYSNYIIENNIYFNNDLANNYMVKSIPLDFFKNCLSQVGQQVSMYYSSNSQTVEQPSSYHSRNTQSNNLINGYPSHTPQSSRPVNSYQTDKIINGYPSRTPQSSRSVNEDQTDKIINGYPSRTRQSSRPVNEDQTDKIINGYPSCTHHSSKPITPEERE